MTQLSCMYCGRKLQVKGELTYGKGRCPSCRHIIYITKQNHAETGKHKKDWSKFSNEEIAKMLELKTVPDYSETRLMVWKPVLSTLLPSYDEMTLFTLSFAIIVLYLMSGKFREELYRAIVTVHSEYIIIGVLVAAVGMFFSFVNIFSQREIGDYGKYLMLFFAVIVTAGVGIYSGYIVWDESKGWLLIFPIWNIINGVILLLFLRFVVFDTDCIVENKFDIFQVLASIVSVGIILGLCNYVFKMHWVISYSICVCYTITINDAIHNLFGINSVGKPVDT